MGNFDFALFSELSALPGASGREGAVRHFLLHKLRQMGITDIETDGIGNILVRKRGAKPARHTVLFSAHMDEVGLMVTRICSDGRLEFDTLGGVAPAALAGREVLIEGRGGQLPGVIGTTPVHHLKDKDGSLELPEMRIDIGARDEKDAEELVAPGAWAVFAPFCEKLLTDSFAARAIDDCFGCCTLLSLLWEPLPYDTMFAFVAQEELGLRGATVLARAVRPEIAVVLEATTAADIAGIPEGGQVCGLGGGAVLSFADGRTVYDGELYEKASRLFEENDVPWQTKTKIAGGNDAGAYALAGARTVGLSLPCRYLHGPVSLARLSDAESCVRAARLLAETLPGFD